MKTLTQYITEFVKTGKIKNDAVQVVDLGLPSGTLWCDRNVGAESPEDPGLLFQWGYVDGIQYRDANSVNHYKNDRMDVHPSGTPAMSYADNSELCPEDDAVTVNLGSQFQMPSAKDFKELLDNTDIQPAENDDSGVLLVSKKNGNSIFLPFGGSFDGFRNRFELRGVIGYYQSRTSGRCGRVESSYSGQYMGINKKYSGIYDSSRYYGYSVRGIKKR